MDGRCGTETSIEVGCTCMASLGAHAKAVVEEFLGMWVNNLAACLAAENEFFQRLMTAAAHELGRGF